MGAGAGRQIRVAGLVVAICALAWATPRPMAAASGWQLTANPTTIAGQAATIELRVTDTEGSGDIACARIAIGAEFEVLDVGVRGTSAPSPWVAEVAGPALTTVSVRNPDGNGKLKAGGWVDVYVTASGDAVGSHSWTANALQNNDCTGDPFLEPISLVITVDSAAAPVQAAPTPVGAEPIAPPAAAPVAEGSPAPTFAFRSRAGALDATEAEATPGATTGALSEVAEPAGASADAGGTVDETRAREVGAGNRSTSSGLGALIALVAILGAVGLHWLLTERRRRTGDS